LVFWILLLNIIENFIADKTAPSNNINHKFMNKTILSKLLSTNSLLLLLLSVITVLITDNFMVQLANTHDDDNPVTYAHFLQNQENYEGDILSTYGHQYGLGTIQNILPSMLLNTIGFPPEILAWIFVFLQNVLLGFALLRYVHKVTGRKDIAILTIFFAFASIPWRWNLANYDSMMNLPYVGHLVLPFIIFAAAEVIEGRFLRVIGLLIISATIHSVLTLYMILIISIFWILQFAFKDWRKLLERMLFLMGVAAVCIIPPLLLQYSGFDHLNDSELMIAIRKNIHMYPWNYIPRWSQTLPTLIGIMVITFIAFQYREGINPRFIQLWFSTLISSIVLALLHIIGIIFEIPLFCQLAPLRATTLLVMFSLPLIIAYLSKKLVEKKFISSWSAISIIILFAYSRWMEFNFLWGFIIVLLLNELKEGNFGPFRIEYFKSKERFLQLLSWVFLVSFLGLTLLPNANNSFHFSISGYNISEYHILHLIAFTSILSFIDIASLKNSLIFSGLVIILMTLITDYLLHINPEFGQIQILLFLFGCSLFLCGIVFSFNKIIQMRQLLIIRVYVKKLKFMKYHGKIVSLIALLIIINIIRARNMGINLTSPKEQANYEAQLWARDNTAVNARFMIFQDNWRTISQRPVIYMMPQGGYYTYTRSRIAKEFTDDLIDFYGMQNDWEKMSQAEYHSIVTTAYYNLSETDIIQMGEHFGGDYIVRQSISPLNFEEVYSNDYINIYKLPK